MSLYSKLSNPWRGTGNSGLRPRWAECWASLVAQLVKNQPAMQETPVQFLGREDDLEKGTTATHSSILAWKIHGLIKSDTTERLLLSLANYVLI